MSEKNKAPGLAGACAGAGFFGIAGSNPASIAQPHDNTSGPDCQESAALSDLADQARGQAHRAGLMAEACRAAGDVKGWELWRRRQLAHQAVQREAERGQGASYE